MRHPFKVAPIAGDLVVTSPFGRRVDPVTKQPGTLHNGIDLRASIGTPIFAPFDGVVSVFSNEAGGLQMLITHKDGWRVGFAHLDGVEVSSGMQVSAGDVVARAGNSGAHTTGAHLHLTLRAPGKTEVQDPKPFLFGGGLGPLIVSGVAIYATLKGYG